MVAGLSAAPFGEPASSIATTLVGDLNVPMLTLLILLAIFFGGKSLYFHIRLNKLVNLALGIGNLGNSSFPEMDGTLTFYEIPSGDTTEYRIMINHVKFGGGYVSSEDPQEGHRYPVHCGLSA